VTVEPGLKIEAKLYLFLAPHSYTGDDVAEIHIYTNSSVTEALMGTLLSNCGAVVRLAGPGEFTARAYLNGKMDLTQAEAVNEIIVSSNKYQLAASEKLLAGRLAKTTTKLRAKILDCLSLLEAGLDFSGEDIEFITWGEAVKRLACIKNELERLVSGSISYEQVADMPAVGIAGAPNAGKSSLLNKLLGEQRSIVSGEYKTTRDVLSGQLRLGHCSCVLFDCAGLIKSPQNILDELAQQAAIEALRNSCVVISCIDISKKDLSEDMAIRNLIEPKALIAVATKADLLGPDALAERIATLNATFEADFSAVSAKTGAGLELLRDTLEARIIELTAGPTAPAGPSKRAFSETMQQGVPALTARHRQAVSEAVSELTESIDELKAGNDEVTAMLLRAAYQALSSIEQHDVDEKVLEKIFQRFCVGK